jgi:hypothetical protein
VCLRARVHSFSERESTVVMEGHGMSQHYVERRGADRRLARRWVWRDRRTGFDRRYRPGSRVATAWNQSLLHLRDNPLSLVALLALANLLSVLDLAFTLWALDHGATEANPLMRVLLDGHPVAAVFVKVGLVAGVSVIVYLMRRYRLMLQVAVLAVALFAAIVIYHCFGVMQLA